MKDNHFQTCFPRYSSAHSERKYGNIVVRHRVEQVTHHHYICCASKMLHLHCIPTSQCTVNCYGKS